jgi:hypothetical protein
MSGATLSPTRTVEITARGSTPIRYYHTQDNCMNLAARTRPLTLERARERGLEECPHCERERLDKPHPNAESGGGADVEECSLCGDPITSYPTHLPCNE